MTRFVDRMLAGEVPTSDDWREHLLQFHEKYPEATSRAFRRLTDAVGRSSYEILADAAVGDGHAPARILDVGCGDGTLLEILGRRVPSAELFGIDLCESDVVRARARLTANSGRIIVGDAAQIPFPSGSIDLVVSHLALMLIPNVEPVISEIRRIVAPGGRLVFVTDLPGAISGELTEAFRAVREVLVSEYPHIARAVVSDPRIYDSEAIDKLLSSIGFPAVPKREINEVTSFLEGDDLWRFIETTYFVGLLDRRLSDRIRTKICDRTASGRAMVTMPLQLTTVDC